jgi:uncharacterized membrane-anchored protein YitT (DUF2179 family)
MSRMDLQTLWKQLRQIVWNLLQLTAGSAICAVAINGLLIPQHFVSGGFTGLSLTFHYLVPWLSVASLYFLLNVPLFIASWFLVNQRFFFYSVAGMVIFSICVALVQVNIPLEDPLLCALLAGIILGTGSGIILRSLGSSGGTDILSVILFQRLSVQPGTTLLAFNIIVLAGCVFLFSLKIVLYTLIYLYVSSQLINVVLTGLSQRKAIFIVSSKWEAISSQILQQINRGITILHGEGGYSGSERRVLYTVVNFRELGLIKHIIRREDPEAFVVVTDTREVMGYRIGNQPHW